MPNQYDSLGTSYDATKSIPATRSHVATLDHVVGSVANLRILDLACGSGFYSRQYIAQGASHVTGVDLSSGMIKSAEEATGADPKIRYIVGDCTKPLYDVDVPEGSFDLVLGFWLLNYATNQEELNAMWKNIATRLKPGGRFVGLRPTWDPEDCEDWYGVSRKVLDRFEGGFSRRSWLGEGKDKEKVNFVNYMLTWEMYQKGAEVNGMVGLKKEETQLPKGEEQDLEYWKPFLEKPTFEVITATKSG